MLSYSQKCANKDFFFSVKCGHSFKGINFDWPVLILKFFFRYVYIIPKIFQCACNEVARDGAVHIILATLTTGTSLGM